VGPGGAAAATSAAPTGRDEPDWAAKIHLSGAPAPVYYHNYLLRGETPVMAGRSFFVDDFVGG
jgi:hypothetical protein